MRRHRAAGSSTTESRLPRGVANFVPAIASSSLVLVLFTAPTPPQSPHKPPLFFVPPPRP
uniref:Uncharacterized protein n=1 Tax=Physcomitrium patens TaxID=3218 RepID=A0A2K1J8B2_PHYPA|nr:hypothetical protein PHYPA_020889 [Physcomitrium patens]